MLYYTKEISNSVILHQWKRTTLSPIWFNARTQEEIGEYFKSQGSLALTHQT